jgi:hypothetical protein
MVLKLFDNETMSLYQRSIMLFWAIWSTMVALSDTFNVLQQFGYKINNSLSSNNINLVKQSLQHYHWDNPYLSLFIFSFIVLGAWVVALFAWRGLKNLRYAYQAFMAIFIIEAIFTLADEFFFQYDIEHGHILRLSFKLISFLVFLKFNTTDKVPKL